MEIRASPFINVGHLCVTSCRLERAASYPPRRLSPPAAAAVCSPIPGDPFKTNSKHCVLESEFSDLSVDKNSIIASHFAVTLRSNFLLSDLVQTRSKAS